jgi:hypothetical protein
MLTVLGRPPRCCDGMSRRESLQAGALAVQGGLSLADVLRAEGSRRPGASSRVPRPTSAGSSGPPPPASRASRSASTSPGWRGG